MPLRELQELVNPALLDASGLTLSSVMGSPGSGFEGTESSSIPRMSVDGLLSDRAVVDALTALKKRSTKSNETALLKAVMAVMEDRADSQRGLVAAALEEGLNKASVALNQAAELTKTVALTSHQSLSVAKARTQKRAESAVTTYDQLISRLASLHSVIDRVERDMLTIETRIRKITESDTYDVMSEPLEMVQLSDKQSRLESAKTSAETKLIDTAHADDRAIKGVKSTLRTEKRDMTEKEFHECMGHLGPCKNCVTLGQTRTVPGRSPTTKVYLSVSGSRTMVMNQLMIIEPWHYIFCILSWTSVWILPCSSHVVRFG